MEVSKILFNNLLNLELKPLIFSFGLVLRFDRSLIKVVVVQSSPNFNKKCSSNVSQLVIDLASKEKYKDLADPSNV